MSHLKKPLTLLAALILGSVSTISASATNVGPSASSLAVSSPQEALSSVQEANPVGSSLAMNNESASANMPDALAQEANTGVSTSVMTIATVNASVSASANHAPLVVVA